MAGKKERSIHGLLILTNIIIHPKIVITYIAKRNLTFTIQAGQSYGKQPDDFEWQYYGNLHREEGKGDLNQLGEKERGNVDQLNETEQGDVYQPGEDRQSDDNQQRATGQLAGNAQGERVQDAVDQHRERQCDGDQDEDEDITNLLEFYRYEFLERSGA